MPEKRTGTDSIRQYVRSNYIERTRRSRQQTFVVRAGDVHAALDLHNRIPQVCQALRSKKFLKENGIELERWEGPPSGNSTTVLFHYRFAAPAPENETAGGDWFSSVRGLGKEVFRSLGGGEAFLRAERAKFYGDKTSR